MVSVCCPTRLYVPSCRQNVVKVNATVLFLRSGRDLKSAGNLPPMKTAPLVAFFLQPPTQWTVYFCCVVILKPDGGPTLIWPRQLPTAPSHLIVHTSWKWNRFGSEKFRASRVTFTSRLTHLQSGPGGGGGGGATAPPGAGPVTMPATSSM